MDQLLLARLVVISYLLYLILPNSTHTSGLHCSLSKKTQHISSLGPFSHSSLWLIPCKPVLVKHLLLPFLVQVDAELLVKDLKRSVKRRQSSVVGAGNAVSANAQQQGGPRPQLISSEVVAYIVCCS